MENSVVANLRFLRIPCLHAFKKGADSEVGKTHLPKTSAILQALPRSAPSTMAETVVLGMVSSFMISVMDPRVSLEAHRGDYKGVLRYHLGGHCQPEHCSLAQVCKFLLIHQHPCPSCELSRSTSPLAKMWMRSLRIDGLKESPCCLTTLSRTMSHGTTSREEEVAENMHDPHSFREAISPCHTFSGCDKTRLRVVDGSSIEELAVCPRQCCSRVRRAGATAEQPSAATSLRPCSRSSPQFRGVVETHRRGA